MTSRESAYVALIATAATLGAACRGDEGRDVGLKDRTKATGAQELRKSTLDDQRTVAALASHDGPYRVIYDPPVDLSYSNAVAKRPDLTNLDTIRARAAAAAAPAATPAGSATAAQATAAPGPQPGASGRRDKTGGDASTDTSGGAARRPKP